MALPKFKWLTVNEIAEYLDVSRQTVVNYIISGELKAHRMGGRYKVTQEQLQDFIVASKNIPQAEQTAN